jgi:low temperature requirement protein LtrA
VFAVTQVTALLAHRPTWPRFGEAMLLLALVWWAWSAFVWAANAQDEDSRALRYYLLAGMVLIGMGLLLIGAILCIGESILAIGVGLSGAERRLTVGLVLGGGLALLVAIGLWWMYFDRFAERAQERLRAHADPVLAAADAYSYIHLIIVAGIIIFAGGVRLVVHNPVSTPMPPSGRFALCGGVAVYLLGVAGFRWRIAGERSAASALAAVVLLVLAAVGGGGRPGASPRRS